MSNNYEESLDFEIRFLNSSLNINNKLLILNVLKKYSTFTLKEFKRGNAIGAIDPPFFNQVVEGENYSFQVSSFEVLETPLNCVRNDIVSVLPQKSITLEFSSIKLQYIHRCDMSSLSSSSILYSNHHHHHQQQQQRNSQNGGGSSGESNNSSRGVVFKVLCNKTLFRMIISSSIELQDIDCYRSRYHHWTDLKSIVQHSHFGLIGYRLRLQHHIAICNDGIRSLCLNIKSYEIFKQFYSQHQSLFLDHELLFLAIKSGCLEIVKLLSCQTTPIRFSRSRKVTTNQSTTTSTTTTTDNNNNNSNNKSETILQYAWKLGSLDIYFYLLHTENQDLVYTPTIYKSMMDDLMSKSNAQLIRTVMAKGSQELINTLIQHSQHANHKANILRTNDVQLIMQLLPNHKFTIESLNIYFGAISDGCKPVNLDQQLSLLFLASGHFKIELNSSDLNTIVDDILDRLKQQLIDYKYTSKLEAEMHEKHNNNNNNNNIGNLETLKKHINIIEIYRL
ncbi:hypothetical protein PPL_01775 [Heterostelium album PN500]|uniref:Ankyrin repeat-containing protein n=1 Tax=Heterostelium pallidum (strain ATCC 26659 / Pp 5 / PN500) TaxID=670386 RepID=D3B0F9_HETP5|nr:hypothetical protein PPL_01775 [Heterostelium album PN500]EFA84783.1 hypothetical protein PPL_01775 [Heterostelium album PN500]|eukprot:XP_020436895.1 hypothetical protein PPL_01775 [Heterostelium album PN500]